MMMLMIRVIVTIRTGRRAPLSTPRFTRMPATGLAQNHPPPEVARQFAQFLRKRHRLIEIGQKLAECISCSHALCSPFKGTTNHVFITD
jgi:hypothetical protein